MKISMTATLGLTLGTLCFLSVPEAAAQAELPPGESRVIVESTCTACHDSGVVTSKGGTREEWATTIQNMIGYGATLDEASVEPLIDYLATNFGPVAEGEVADASLPPANPDYEVDMAWTELPEGMTWDASTSSLAADGDGQVVVLVRTAPYFRVFTRDGEFVRAWGDDPDLFELAHSLMFDGEGFLWATDSNGHAVHKFSAEGELLMTLGRRGEAGDNSSRDLFNRPNATAIAPNGDIYVSDGYINSRIVHFNRDGEFIRIIGGEIGEGPGQLTLPHGVVVDSNGRIIVGDSENQRISVFDADGNFVETWPVPSRGGMAIDENDTVYVSDVNANAVYVVRDGEVLDVIGGLGRAHGLSLDSDGTIYASDSANRQVMKIERR